MRSVLEYHPVIGYRFIPSIKARILHESGGYLIRCNNLGFRCNRDIQIGAKSKKRRVLIFGDSYTAGEGVCNEVRYSDLLESMFKDADIYNFGLPGTGTDQQYLTYKTYAENLQPDLVIISVMVENIRRNVCRYRPFYMENRSIRWLAKPYYSLNGKNLILHNQPVPPLPLRLEDLPVEERKYCDWGGRFKFFRALGKKLSLKDGLLRLGLYNPVPEFKNPSDPDWKLMSAILKRWISECTSPVLLNIIPLYHFVEGYARPTDYQDRFKEFAKETGVVVHDPLDYFFKYTPTERRGFRFPISDAHPTEKCHRALAESMGPSIKSILKS